MSKRLVVFICVVCLLGTMIGSVLYKSYDEYRKKEPKAYSAMVISDVQIVGTDWDVAYPIKICNESGECRIRILDVSNAQPPFICERGDSLKVWVKDDPTKGKGIISWKKVENYGKK